MPPMTFGVWRWSRTCLPGSTRSGEKRQEEVLAGLSAALRQLRQGRSPAWRRAASCLQHDQRPFLQGSAAAALGARPRRCPVGFLGLAQRLWTQMMTTSQADKPSKFVEALSGGTDQGGEPPREATSST